MVAGSINQPIKLDQIAPTTKTSPVDPQSNAANPAVRPGVNGASRTTSVPPVPGTPGDPTVNQVDLGAAFASLLKFLPIHDDPEVDCAEAMDALAKAQQLGDYQEVKFSFAKRQEVCAAKLKAAQDMQKELDSVKDSPWWCGALKVLAVVVAVIAAPFTGGGSLAIVALALLAVSMTDHYLVEKTGCGIAGNVCLHICGGSKEDAKKADKVFGIVLGVALLVVAVLTLTCGDTKTAMEGWARLANAAATTTAAAGTIGESVINFQNSGHQADAQRAQAREEMAEAVLDQLDEYVKQILQRMTNNSASWSRIQEEVTGTLADRSYQTSRIRFA